MTLSFASNDASSVPLTVLTTDDYPAWISDQPEKTQNWLKTMGFKAGLGQTAIIPDDAGLPVAAVGGIGARKDMPRHRFALATIQSALPDGTYHLKNGDSLDLSEQTLAWLLAQYRFTRYKAKSPSKTHLKAPAGIDAQRIEAIANGEAFTRNLINTPAEHMGPPELENAMKSLATHHNAKLTSTRHADLLKKNFPLIHTVGRAAEKEPRLLDLSWGSTGPSLTLVGKGVCFDTGGLNLKPGASMGLMKKDMGGAATVLGLAHMIMALDLPLRLRVLVPAVENNVSGSAFRPGDVFKSRKGLTVEINNTDAEGRLVLADALALADETPPDLLISMATLTGAARVAVGPDLAPFYSTDPALSDALRAGAVTAADPVWEMPFHAPYEHNIEPDIADLDNAPKGGFAGSITAALFLKRFVTDTARYAHFDIYGWQPSPAPGRPKGGVGQGARALLDALPSVLNL